MIVEQTQFDRFFYGDYRCRLVSFDPRRNEFTIQLYGGGERDGEILRGVHRPDIRFHWDCPKGHPDW